MKGRYFYLDVLRVIAIVSVVLMHSSSVVQKYYGLELNAFPFQFTNIFNTITRFAVPLFIMISGCLMINRGTEYKKTLAKVRHYIVLYCIWSLIYSVILIELKYYKTYSLIGLIVNTISDTLIGHFHFWYLFLICGMYLILPFIEILANNMTEIDKKIFVILNVFLCFVLPTILLNEKINEILGQHMKHLNVGFLGGYVLYFMLGYWLKEYTVKNKKILYILMIVSVLYTVIVTNVPSAIMEREVTGLRENLTPNILILTISIFLIVKEKIKDKCSNIIMQNIITKLSELSFGVYLVHMLVIELLSDWCLSVTSNCITALIMEFFITLCISFSISYVLYDNQITRFVVK